MASSNGHTESADTTGTGIETVVVRNAASKQTAAEKFDLVPPWVSLGTACVVALPDTFPCKWAKADGSWGDSSVPDIAPAQTRAIARLTRPLPSWEPAPDCALPVEGWNIRKCADGNYGVFTIPDGVFALKALTFPDRRAAIVWAWTEAPAPEERKPITDGTVATDGLDARVSKVEGVLARICPEADEQTDGKGRTLREIDDAINDRIAEFHDLGGRIAAVSERVESLIAASVPVPAKVSVRSGAASTNEAMTEAAASDEGWREMLVVSRNGLVYDHTHGWFLANGKWSCSMCPDKLPKTILPDDETRRQIATCPPPPNLAEWYKPKEVPVTAGELAARMVLIKQAENAVPSTYRVGDDLAAWVRNLALCHDAALKLQDKLRNDAVAERDTANRLRSDLAAAQAATVAAEGRAATAKKRATEAESKLAELRSQLEAALT